MTEDQAAQLIAQNDLIVSFLRDVFPSTLVLAFAFVGVALGRLVVSVGR